MSHFFTPEPEDLIQCPYDKVHMVRAKRFPYHLMKCRKNHMGREYSVCPFNAQHEMPRPELRHHMACCPDKARLQQDLVISQLPDRPNYIKGDTSLPDQSTPSLLVNANRSAEWDDMIPQIPKFHITPTIIKASNVFRRPQNLKPAQKKACQERLLENYKREQEGLPPLTEEQEEVEEVHRRTTSSFRGPEELRLPRADPVALQFKSPGRPKPDTPHVFCYSLSMAGLGRGIIAKPPGSKRVVGQVAPPHSREESDSGSQSSRMTTRDYVADLHRLGLGRGTPVGSVVGSV